MDDDILSIICITIHLVTVNNRPQIDCKEVLTTKALNVQSQVGIRYIVTRTFQNMIVINE
jgi:hypothetical protein